MSEPIFCPGRPCGDLSTFATALNAMVDYNRPQFSELFHELVDSVINDKAVELHDLWIKTIMKETL